MATVVPLSAALTVAFGDAASAPPGSLTDPRVPAGPAAGVEYTTITAPGYAVPRTGRVADLAPRASSTADIPDLALAAYQRASAVINAADESCHLPWQLLAAVGRVESNHGQFAGSTLDPDGVASPAIIGARLDGRGGTTRIGDTDAGQLDDDLRFDRAVGPMQFIPSTWAFVGVDADGDGRRDPQDIDDAALSAAVYLCVGPGDLSTSDGARAAVYRYNHSQRYVDLVLEIAASYAAGDAWQVVTGTATYPTPSLLARPGPPSTSGLGPGTPMAVPVPAQDPAPVQPVEPVPWDSDPPTDPAPYPPAGPPTEPPTEPPVDPEPVDPEPVDPEPVDPEPVDPTPEETANLLCTELGFVDDPADLADGYDTCLTVALESDAEGTGTLVITPEVLAELLTELGLTVPVPPLP